MLSRATALRLIQDRPDTVTLRERAAALRLGVARVAVEPPNASPSKIARVAAYVIAGRNRINALPPSASDDELNAIAEPLAAAERDLCDYPAVTVADLAVKARVLAANVEDQLPDDGGDDLSNRAWLALRADVERLARGTPIAGSYRECGPGTDERTRAYPVFLDAAGRQYVDPVFSLIEAARYATRRANEPLPGEEAEFRSPEGQAAHLEGSARLMAEDHAYVAVFSLRPTTREGLFALVDYARERADFQAAMVQNGSHGAACAAPDVLGAIRDGMATLLDDVREVAAPDPDAALLAWEVPFERAMAAHREALRASEEASDEEVDRLYRAADAAARPALDAIEAIPARTLRGLRLKARVVSLCHDEEAIGETAFSGGRDRPARDLRMAAAIVRDLLSLTAVEA